MGQMKSLLAFVQKNIVDGLSFDRIKDQTTKLWRFEVAWGPSIIATFVSFSFLILIIFEL